MCTKGKIKNYINKFEHLLINQNLKTIISSPIPVVAMFYDFVKSSTTRKPHVIYTRRKIQRDAKVMMDK